MEPLHIICKSRKKKIDSPFSAVEFCRYSMRKYFHNPESFCVSVGSKFEIMAFVYTFVTSNVSKLLILSSGIQVNHKNRFESKVLGQIFLLGGLFWFKLITLNSFDAEFGAITFAQKWISKSRNCMKRESTRYWVGLVLLEST